MGPSTERDDTRLQHLRDLIETLPSPGDAILLADLEARGMADSAVLAERLNLSPYRVCVERVLARRILERHAVVGETVPWLLLLEAVGVHVVLRDLTDLEIQVESELDDSDESTVEPGEDDLADEQEPKWRILSRPLIYVPLAAAAALLVMMFVWRSEPGPAIVSELVVASNAESLWQPERAIPEGDQFSVGFLLDEPAYVHLLALDEAGAFHSLSLLDDEGTELQAQRYSYYDYPRFVQGESDERLPLVTVLVLCFQDVYDKAEILDLLQPASPGARADIDSLAEHVRKSLATGLRVKQVAAISLR